MQNHFTNGADLSFFFLVNQFFLSRNEGCILITVGGEMTSSASIILSLKKVALQQLAAPFPG